MCVVQREQTSKELETAIDEGDSQGLDELLQTIDISEFEEDGVSYVCKACKKGKWSGSWGAA